jgi:drug/metabolite transporter (DMT)-like permease
LTTQRRADLLLLSITLVWGSTFVVTKSLLTDNSPLLYAGVRFILASVIVFVLFFKRCISLPVSTIKKGSVLGLLLYIGFAFQNVGLQYTTASKSAFFTGMLTVFTPIVHYIVQHTLKLPRRVLKIGNIFGVMCAAIGLYLLTSPTGNAFNFGDAVTLISALMFAGYIVYLDFASSEPDKIQLMFVQFVLCGVLGLLCALFFEKTKMTMSGDFILSLLYLTIFATVITMWIQIRFQGDTTPTRAAIIFAMEPVVAGIFAYYVRGEVVGTLGIIGGGVIIVGLLVSEFSDEVPWLNKKLG